MEKEKLILLIDDNYADNDYHRYVISDSELKARVKVIEDSRDALDYFTDCFLSENGQADAPDLVFLDINMPAMNGFELLDKVRELHDPNGHKQRIKIFMLSGSLNPEDYETATRKYSDLVTGYRVKPLTEEMLQEIAEKYF